MTQSRWCNVEVKIAMTSLCLLGGLSISSMPKLGMSAQAETVLNVPVNVQVSPPASTQVSSSVSSSVSSQAPQMNGSSLHFSPPSLPDRGRPGGRSSGGASRGSCDTKGQLPLTALVPMTSVSEGFVSEDTADASAYESVFSLTSQDHPTFWFYVPYALSETPVEFVLQDEQNNTIYQNRLVGDSDESGVVSVALPETVPALEVGALYHWYFMAYCDEDSPAFVEGWTERVVLAPDVSAAMVAAATPSEQVALYAQNGIWQEAITLLGTQVLSAQVGELVNEQSQPEEDHADVVEDWYSLLNSVELGDIAPQPIVDCCR